jgi:hypothetical protein
MFILKRHVYKSCHENIFITISKQFLKKTSFKWIEILYVYLSYMCGPLENFMDEFSFLLFEKSMRKKIHIKIWICKTINMIFNLWHNLPLLNVVVDGWQKHWIVYLKTIVHIHGLYNRPYVCCLHTNSMTICWIHLFAPNSSLSCPSLKGILNLLSSVMNLSPFHSINVSEIPNVLGHISI